MKIENTMKQIFSKNEEKNVGNLSYYSISKCRGKVSYIAYVRDDYMKYALNKDIVDFDDSQIYINTVDTKRPTLDNYTLYPYSKLVDKDGNPIGMVTHFEFDKGNITKIYSCNDEYAIDDIISTSYMEVMVDTKAPATQSEASFAYMDVIGKVAKSSLYACNNTPIIIKGEKVRIDNIISAIANHKLIELLKVIL